MGAGVTAAARFRVKSEVYPAAHLVLLVQVRKLRRLNAIVDFTARNVALGRELPARACGGRGRKLRRLIREYRRAECEMPDVLA